MTVEPWFPKGFETASGQALSRVVAATKDWQIYQAQGLRRVLAAHDSLWRRWVSAGYLPAECIEATTCMVGEVGLLDGHAAYRLEPAMASDRLAEPGELEAFVRALRRSAEVELDQTVTDGIYVERLCIVLPGYSLAPPLELDRLAGLRASGGVNVSLKHSRRLRSLAPWLDDQERKKLIGLLPQPLGGIGDGATKGSVQASDVEADDSSSLARDLSTGAFQLPGRPELEAFFNEYVIDVLRDEERYQKLGIGFPGAILLHGPPGCGKTYAVEQLVDFLAWPCFTVDSSTIGSPYIHETGKKVSVRRPHLPSCPSLAHPRALDHRRKRDGIDRGMAVA